MRQSITQISVGRMRYEECLQRGTVDRSWKLEKLSFHRDSSYNTVKKICQEATWPEEDSEVEFYIADGSGVSIEKEQLEVMSDDGKKNYVSWTLSNYLKLSHIKYPSRARLYCVRVAKGIAIMPNFLFSLVIVIITEVFMETELDSPKDRGMK